MKYKIKKVDRAEEWLKKNTCIFFKLKNISLNDNVADYCSTKKELIKYFNYLNKYFNLNLKENNSIINIKLEKILFLVKNSIGEKNKIRKIEDTIRRTTKKEYYNLSYAQKRMFILYKLKPKSPSYNINNVKEIIGNLNINVLKNTLTLLIKRHESLRTNFFEIKGKPVQKINLPYRVKINIKDISNIHDRNKFREKKEKIIQKEIKAPFDLALDPLLRVTLIKNKLYKHGSANNKYTLIIVMHHIISDAWSTEIFNKEFTEIYNAYLKSKEPNLPGLDIQYKDYAQWEQTNKYKEKIKKQERYWLKELSGELPVLNLPTDKLRPLIQTYNGGREEIILDKETAKKLKTLSRQTNITLFTLLFAIFNVFLNRITGQSDIIIGTPIANRSYNELQNVVGCFLNNLSIRSDLSKNVNFLSFLKKTEEKIIMAIGNGEYSFENLLKKIKPRRDSSRSLIFNTVFQISFKDNKLNKLSKLKVSEKSYDDNTNKYDFKVKAIIEDCTIRFVCKYSIDLFNNKTIENFLKIFCELLKDVSAKPNKKIGEFELIPREEREKQILRFNNIQKKYPKNKTIHNLFERQVKKTPNNIALEFEGEQFTYRELNEKANQLARYLREEENVRSNEVVSIFLNRSFNSTIAILAVLKIGASYLPIDTSSPQKRISYTMDNANSLFIITNKKYNKKLLTSKKRKKVLIDDMNLITNKKSKKNLNLKLDLNDSACIIYTSGSTGFPKGVIITRGGIVNYVYTKIVACKGRKRILTENDVFCQSASVGFVLAVWQLLMPLTLGAKVMLYSDKIVKNPIYFFRKIDEDKVTLIQIVPSFLLLYMDSIKNIKKYNKMASLKEIQLAGETIPPFIVNDFYSKYKVPLVNVYGSSEISDDGLHYEIPYKLNNNKILSGKPLVKEVYILNSNQKLQPAGIEGEICIAGNNMSIGYIKDKKKTDKAFLVHPFIKNARIYKTGDLAKMHFDGNIEILGRIDNQVSIHGNRVELGEIEVKIQGYTEIKRVIVIMEVNKKNKGEKKLVAYYTTHKDISLFKMRKYLMSILPSYMVPVYFVYLEEFPLNQNGKLDRLSLPVPTEKDMDKARYKKPKTEIERRIIKIWQKVLGIKKVGLNDNFFDLGGDSLKIIVLHSKLEKSFKSRVINIAKLFSYSTVLEMAECISKENNGYSKKKLIKSKKELNNVFSDIGKNMLSADEAFDIIKNIK